MPPNDLHRIHESAVKRWQDHYMYATGSLPYIQAELEVIHGRRSAALRPARWIDTLHSYETFSQSHGRTPREKPIGQSECLQAERRLAEWARYQRRFEENLNNFQVARLDTSPGFEWDLREHSWGSMLQRCVVFSQDHGRLPHLNISSRAEYVLARWLRRQLHRQRAGVAEPSRTAKIEALLRLNG